MLFLSSPSDISASPLGGTFDNTAVLAEPEALGTLSMASLLPQSDYPFGDQSER